MNLWNAAKGCAACRVCEGSAYQTPPLLFAGNPDAPILALGQNPGEIKPDDKARQDWITIFGTLGDEIVGQITPAWYAWDFYSSPGHDHLAKIFGKGWLLDGQIMWSNAVRCRTPKNAPPGEGMLETCKTWTSQLLEQRKAIIMVGAMARLQIMGDEAEKLEWGTPKRHPQLGYVLAVRHYSVWKGDEAATYKKAVDKIKERIA